MKKDYATYWIAFKILLKKKGKVLFLTETASKCNFLDLPGGRADNNEGKVSLFKILEREVREELGDRIKYRLGEPIFQYRRYNKERKIYNLITVYKAEYITGSINLSFEHSKYQWLNPKKYKFREKEFYNKEEYEAFRKYFKRIG